MSEFIDMVDLGVVDYPDGSQKRRYYYLLDDNVKMYFLGKDLHREDGPAIENSDGFGPYFLHGEYISCLTQEEFEKIMKLLVFV